MSGCGQVVNLRIHSSHKHCFTVVATATLLSFSPPWSPSLVHHQVMTDDSGKSRGFGFVCFATIEEASKALGEMNGQMSDGQQLYVALAQPKEVRQAELARQRMAGLGLGMGGAGNPYAQMVRAGLVPAQVWPSNMLAPPPYHGKGPGGRYSARGGGRYGLGRGRSLKGRGTGNRVRKWL